MYSLPKSTEVARQLHKAGLFKQYNLPLAQRDRINADISRLDFVNAIIPATLPAISEGKEVKGIFVVNVALRRSDFDAKTMELIAKLIPQRIIFALHWEGEVRFAVYHTKLFLSPWQSQEAATLPITGLNMDDVWQNIVSSVGAFEVDDDNTLNEQIQVDEEHAAVQRQIDQLSRQLAATRQPRRRYEIFQQIQKLKGGLL